MSLLDKVNTMREDNSEGTSTPNYGSGVDYVYIGSFTGGDDILGGVLDNLLSDMDYSGSAAASGGCDSCGGGCSKCRGGGQREGITSYNNQFNSDPEGVVVSSPCKYDDCPVVIEDDETESIIINSEPLSYSIYHDTKYVQDDEGSLVVNRKGVPLDIVSTSKWGGTDQSLTKSNSSKPDNIKMTKYSDVCKFIKNYVKTFDDKTFKGDR